MVFGSRIIIFILSVFFPKHFIPPLELLLLFSRIYSCRREICVMELVAFPYIYSEWVDWCVSKYSMRLVVRNSIAMYQYYAQGMKNCILTVHKLGSQYFLSLSPVLKRHFGVIALDSFKKYNTTHPEVINSMFIICIIWKSHYICLWLMKWCNNF